MTTTANATAAPVEIDLAGTKYRMSPLTDADYGELERHLQSRALDVARKMSEGATSQEKEIILKAAYEKAYSINISSPDALRYVSGFEGGAYLLWLGLRHNHPDLTPAKVLPLIMDERTLTAALDKFDDVNATGEPSKKKTGLPATRAEKNRRRKARPTAAPSTSGSPANTDTPQVRPPE